MPTVKEYQEMIKDGCPHCGEALTIKRGRYGEFIACSDWCGYTKSILGRSGEFPSFKAVKQGCPYKECDGSGLIPFTKEGRIIAHAYTFCECHQQNKEEREHFKDIQPADFDYPCSQVFRNMYEDLPTPQPKEEDTPEMPAQLEPEWVEKQWDIVNQVRAEITGWRRKHAEALLEIDKLRKVKPSKKGKFNKYD